MPAYYYSQNDSILDDATKEPAVPNQPHIKLSYKDIASGA
jgi:hypothetical protein